MWRNRKFHPGREVDGAQGRDVSHSVDLAGDEFAFREIDFQPFEKARNGLRAALGGDQPVIPSVPFIL